jgi:guanine nucleotide-binding protein G(I)/G(S)/G(T) subunit beta-1
MKEQLVSVRIPWIMACAFAPSSRLFACGGMDNICSVFSVGSRNVQQELRGHEGYISGVRFVDDSRVFTSSGDMTCRLWDASTAKEICVFRGHRNDATRCVFLPSLFIF